MYSCIYGTYMESLVVFVEVVPSVQVKDDEIVF